MKKQWELLKNALENGTLAHAYLFSGSDDSEKNRFTTEFVKYINCKGKEKFCDRCDNCIMITKGIFSDLLTVGSSHNEDGTESSEIDVAKIREVNHFLAYTPYYGSFKIVVIHNADRMNSEAQNCLLKTLEEPKGKTVIILLSLQSGMFLPTINSRCQEIKFFYTGTYEVSKNEENIFKDLLRILNAELSEKFQYVKNSNLENKDFNAIINFLRKYFRQMFLTKLGVINQKENLFAGEKKLTVEKIKKSLELIEYMHQQARSTNINKKLALETLLMEI